MKYERLLACIGLAVLSQLGLSTIGRAQGLEHLLPGKEYVLNRAGQGSPELEGSVTDLLLSAKADDTYVLDVSVRGADGGWASSTKSSAQALAGGGATVGLTIAVGDGENEIPPGSELRVIVGSRGEYEEDYPASGGGGGGSALLVRRPSLHATWEVVAAAGGGGGGWRAKTAEVAGGSASAENCDPNGPAGRWSLGAGGGGAFESSCQEENPPDYQGTLCASGDIGGQAGYPLGGEGGKAKDPTPSVKRVGDGGFGFGGGGQSFAVRANWDGGQGGGGGGYCGGAPSKGGGSWLEERFSFDGNITRIDGKETGPTDWGEVRLRLSRAVPGPTQIVTEDGYYVATNEGKTSDGEDVLSGDRKEAGPWEQFELVAHEKGTFALRAHTGEYVAANPQGVLQAWADKIGPWETFQLHPFGEGEYEYALYSVARKAYVAPEGTGAVLRAQSGNAPYGFRFTPAPLCFSGDEGNPLLLTGGSLETRDGYRLVLENPKGYGYDELTMYKVYEGSVLWSIPATGYVEESAPARLVFQNDGDLVLYNNVGSVAFRSGTAGTEDPLFCIGDGEMSLFRRNDSGVRFLVWSYGR